MKQLSYQTLQGLGSRDFVLEAAPERVLQFGEGNFLRAFVDYFFDLANEQAGFNGKIVVVQPISGSMQERFQKQDCLYTLYLRGMENGRPVERRRVISSISRCLDATSQFDAVLDCARNLDLRYIVSNTTEAGIVFRAEDRYDDITAASYPAKLTRFLHERFLSMGGSDAPGFVLLPCELIDFNGTALRECVMRYIELWQMDLDFAAWVEQKNEFCNTLVDRIVPGYPRDDAARYNEENGYTDELLDTGELFGFWAIEGRESLGEELPFQKIGLPVLVTPDYTPYKRRKVCILNGAHTSMTCAALLCGLVTVEQCTEDADISEMIRRAVYDEIIPTLDLPKQELLDFARDVQIRFQNPYIRHELLSITLNTTSKWRARVLPSLLEYQSRLGALPNLLVLGFAANAALLRSKMFELRDDAEVLDFYAAHEGDSPRDLMAALCAQDVFWGMNLSDIPGFETATSDALEAIESDGMRAALQAALSKEAAL